MREVVEDIQAKYGITMTATKKRMGKGTELDIGAARVYEIPFAKAKLGIEISAEDESPASTAAPTD